MTSTTTFDAFEASERKPDILARAMLVVLALGLLVAGWAVARMPQSLPAAPTPAHLTAAPTPPPPVEPLVLKPVAPTDAVAINAAVPFSTAANPAARPYFLSPASPDYARAVDCLAATGLYEAGSHDPDGQRAVMQVVLNRARHPAYPSTICGVVFQGHERSTGCQFTFTCDGAMRRVPGADAWNRSREIARGMLAGRVYDAVGYATHYHTNWVVPYWSASLDKITAVGTHLFFRWTGWWGTPKAFRTGVGHGEPAFAKLAGLSESHRGGLDPAALAEATMLNGVTIDPANPALLASMNRDVIGNGGDEFIIALGRRLSPEKFTGLAMAACGARAQCKVMGWTERSEMPNSFPVDPILLPAMSFSYLRNRSTGFEKALWNCEEFKRPDAGQCMRNRTPTATASTAPRKTLRMTATTPSSAESDKEAEAAFLAPKRTMVQPQAMAPAQD